MRFTTQSPTISTHKIDPDVDETRTYLIQDLLAANGLEAFAFAGGVGKIPIDQPQGNLTGDPFFTDGRRVVLFMSEDRVPIEGIVSWSGRRGRAPARPPGGRGKKLKSQKSK